MKSFDIFASPLSGTCLIEANAGTGKTYTITGLVIRLLLEKELSIDRILVVTFTEAATAELKSRIRERLRAARTALTTGAATDPFLAALATRYGSDARAGQRLEDAIRGFDQAAIFTIHGFCLRMLAEHAFESGFLFNTELSPDTEKLKLEVTEDYWRREIYPAGPLFVNYLLNRRITPEILLKPLGRHLIHPRLRLEPEVEPALQTQDGEKAFEAALTAVAAAWQAEREKLRELLLTDKSLNRNVLRPGKVRRLIAQMDRLCRTLPKDPDISALIDNFTTAAMAKAVKKNQSPPESVFFRQCDDLARCCEDLQNRFQQRLIALKTGLLHYLRKELDQRKREKNIRGFDDLLSHLHRALTSPKGADLAAAVRRTYGAALIDEFQDTDLLQYGIFNRIFQHEDGLLFLIGDPKQAIYGFRGADIFAYLEAAGKVKARYTLTENWRSDPALIQVLNTVFQEPAFPFVFKDIRFEASRVPRDKQESETLKEAGRCEQPLRIWFLDPGPDAKPLAKTAARPRIIQAVAGEIARLLSWSRQGLITLGQGPLEPGHVAVLVRRNEEAVLIKAALADRGIPAVVYNSGNIFETQEAFEMELLLRGLLFHDNPKVLKAAMTTDLYGLSADEVAEMEANESLWEERVAAFKHYHGIWQREGFMRMFRQCLRAEKMRLRLMELPDGERRNTNVAQLAEILHQESLVRHDGLEGLLQWFARRRGPGQAEQEEHQLRLESDAQAVKLITMHKSKGLEFPIVFCPFTWDGSGLGQGADCFSFHDPGRNNELVLDLNPAAGSPNQAAAERELLAENLRLFYVALTRAKNRCYLVWGRLRDAQTSAPAHVLHHQAASGPEEAMAAHREKAPANAGDALWTDLKGLAAKAQNQIKIEKMPEEWAPFTWQGHAKNLAMTCRDFTGTIRREFRIASFSGFVHRHPHAAEAADRDALLTPMGPETVDSAHGSSGSMDIFTFPKGARPGTCLHGIFERLDFSADDPVRIKNLVEEQLKAFCFDPGFEPAVTRMVQNVLAVPLDAGAPELRLERIRLEECLHEMEFYFPLARIRPTELKGIFQDFAGAKFSSRALSRLEHLDSAAVQGYMKGFMDLVFRYQGRFYILDWKSNHLGIRPEDYNQDRMTQVMEAELYFLQYHIYTVALTRYLQVRLTDFDYQSHFGGVWYIFLRGVDPQKPHLGIYHDRPEEDLIRRLTGYLTES